MNNGVYTLYVNAGPSQVSSPSAIEFGSGIPGQKVLVFSGIALPEMDTDDDDDVGHPRVFIRLGRFVRHLLSSSVVVGLASVSNDDSGFVLATDTASAERDPASGELFLNIGCGLSGDDTWIHRIGYQAVFIVEEDAIKITGEVDWSPDLRDATHDTTTSLSAVLHVRSGQLVSVPQPGAPPGTFGQTAWQAYSNGSITGITRRGDGWVATFEILGLPVITPIHVVVDVAPGFAQGRTDIGAFRVGGPDPVILSGSVPEVDGVNFRLGVTGGVR
jgi:hypothetical protein